MTRIRPVLTTALAALLAAPAVACADWTVPSAIRYQDQIAPLRGAPQVVGNPADLAVAIADAGRHTEASTFTNGVFLDPRPLTGGNITYGPASGDIATYAKTRLLAAGLRRSGQTAQAIFAFGRLTPNRSSLGSPRRLGPANLHAGAAALAVNAAGDAAMVYPVCRDAGCARALVYLAVRRAGSSSVSSTRLFDSTGPLPRVAAAVNARGDALAVWTTSGEVRARIRTAGGRLRSARHVGPIARGTTIAPSAALSAHRAALVGWFSQDAPGGEAGSGAAYAAQARDTTAYSTVATLGRLPALGGGQAVGGAGVRVSFDPLGRRLAVWTTWEDGRFAVRSAELLGAANSGRAEPTDPVLLSDPAVDTVLADLDVTPAGAQVVTLAAGQRGTDPVAGRHIVAEVATRMRGGRGPFTRTAVSRGDEDALVPRSTIAGTSRIITAWTTPSGDDRFAQRIGEPV